jgi:TatD DNase family protein
VGPLYDAHQHFHFDELVPYRTVIDTDLRQLDVRRAVVNGTNEAEWPVIAALAKKYDWIRPSYGLHPWDCGNRSPDWLASLRTVLMGDPRSAVGEIGLDRWIIDRLPADDPRLAGLRVASLSEQAEVCTAQLALAAELNRAASIHCVQAWGALRELLEKTARPARGFLLHGYAGPAEMIPVFTELGAYYSFNLQLMEPQRADCLNNFKHLPIDRLLVETDAPSKAPPFARNRFLLGTPAVDPTLNHPANILLAYEMLAEIRGLSLDALTREVETNFIRLFG